MCTLEREVEEVELRRKIYYTFNFNCFMFPSDIVLILVTLFFYCSSFPLKNMKKLWPTTCHTLLVHEMLYGNTTWLCCIVTCKYPSTACDLFPPLHYKVFNAFAVDC